MKQKILHFSIIMLLCSLIIGPLSLLLEEPESKKQMFTNNYRVPQNNNTKETTKGTLLNLPEQKPTHQVYLIAGGDIMLSRNI